MGTMFQSLDIFQLVSWQHNFLCPGVMNIFFTFTCLSTGFINTVPWYRSAVMKEGVVLAQGVGVLVLQCSLTSLRWYPEKSEETIPLFFFYAI